MTRTAFFAMLSAPLIAPFIPKRETVTVDSSAKHEIEIKLNIKPDELAKFVERGRRIQGRHL